MSVGDLVALAGATVLLGAIGFLACALAGVPSSRVDPLICARADGLGPVQG